MGFEELWDGRLKPLLDTDRENAYWEYSKLVSGGATDEEISSAYAEYRAAVRAQFKGDESYAMGLSRWLCAEVNGFAHYRKRLALDDAIKGRFEVSHGLAVDNCALGDGILLGWYHPTDMGDRWVHDMGFDPTEKPIWTPIPYTSIHSYTVPGYVAEGDVVAVDYPYLRNGRKGTIQVAGVRRSR